MPDPMTLELSSSASSSGSGAGSGLSRLGFLAGGFLGGAGASAARHASPSMCMPAGQASNPAPRQSLPFQLELSGHVLEARLGRGVPASASLRGWIAASGGAAASARGWRCGYSGTDARVAAGGGPGGGARVGAQLAAASAVRAAAKRRSTRGG